jgi:hypothetical protein
MRNHATGSYRVRSVPHFHTWLVSAVEIHVLITCVCMHALVGEGNICTHALMCRIAGVSVSLDDFARVCVSVSVDVIACAFVRVCRVCECV